MKILINKKNHKLLHVMKFVFNDETNVNDTTFNEIIIGHTEIRENSNGFKSFEIELNPKYTNQRCVIECIAQIDTPSDLTIYLYRIYDNCLCEYRYMMINHVPYHENGIFHELIEYENFMLSDNDIDALIEFANDCKQYDC